MSPIETLECPLLRCRKRFPDHESMLKHLYTCDLLYTGEYWCYDCGKPEKFTDRKCKRCLGHPGKRRKIIKIAKSFFSNLGLKTRKDGTPTLNQDDTTLSINFDDILDIQPEKFELSSCNEIAEIDSHEIPLTLPPSHLRASFATTSQPQSQGSEQCHLLRHQHFPATSPGAAAGFPQSQLLDPYAGMGHLHSMPDTFSWELDPGIVGAGDVRGTRDIIDITAEPLDQTLYAERPSLQLNTYGLVPPTYRRGKKLSPQSSVRSNASTSTTFSNTLSPASVLSSGWSVASGFETDMTSPTSDSVSDGGFLSRGGSSASRQSRFVCETIYELPADLPVAVPLLQNRPEKLCPDDQLMPIQTCPSTTPPKLPAPHNLALTKHSDARGIISHTDRPSRSSSADPDFFVSSAWETLQTHARSSMEKIRHLSHNPLACQLQSVGPQEIANAGLATFKGILQGQFPTSPLDILCFVHVTYTLSLVIHEDDAGGRAKRLFVQAFLYGDRLPIGLRSSYLEVATAVWYPSDLSQTELESMLLRRRSLTMPPGGTHTGKEHAPSSANQSTEMDELVETARFFLDELEYAALPCNASGSIVVQTSALWTKHLQDIDINVHAGISPDFSITLGFVVSTLSDLFPEPNGLASKLKKVQSWVDVGDIQTVRRVELELIQAGKGSVAGEAYFDHYVPKVRQHCERLYTQPLPGFVPRVTYHLHGIQLVEAIIASRCNKRLGPVGDKKGHEKEEESLDDIFASITADLGDSSLQQLLAPDVLTMTEPMVDVESTINPLASLDSAAHSEPSSGTVYGEEAHEPVSNTHGLCEDTGMVVSQDTAAVLPPPEKTASSVEKVESSQCCEICGFRPKGHPRWFRGSMAKHKKLQHATTPPKIYKCPFPGCKSQYRNRPDNLRQHQLDKGHFVDGEEGRRPSKRKKVEQQK
ncbi:hypothetical protein ACRALDRAFT_1076103 [Sodiomyces alcalophilus JCM 7366]|uniref:uncharacterized protein n=1 Tax=Sodiomyces alcalophilus JCM 7366 TaxID=591952 RepID=UPI0039B5AD71